jgi:uncharacterized cupredoxin-like copper-binding protein
VAGAILRWEALATVRADRETEVKMIARSAVLLSVLALALAGTGAASAAPTVRKADVVRVTAKDYAFVLSRRTVPSGRVEFVIKNDGHTAHDFAIAGHVSKTIQPGGSTTMVVELKAGRHSYKCTVDDHAKFGMHGVLRVT